MDIYWHEASLLCWLSIFLEIGKEKKYDLKLPWVLGIVEHILKPEILILLRVFKGSDQWEGRGCRRSPNHYMLVGEVVLDVFLSF